jgi:hypothetical protein
METNNTKIIDAYLSGSMSETDKISFEENLKGNVALQQEVALQKDLYEAAKRNVTREAVRSTAKKYHLNQKIKWLTAGAAILLLTTAVVAGIWKLNQEETAPAENSSPPSEASFLDTTAVLINDLGREILLWEGKDSVYLSKSGVLLSIPEGAFLKDGKPYIGKAVIEWQEARDGATIMRSGLSTTSNGELLETQGMFSFRAHDENGNVLDLDPEIGIYVQVPVDEIKPGMQLYQGEYAENDIINWVNPSPLEKIPVPVPMSDLNFYPSSYEDTLDQLKLNESKQYRDSLYLACEFLDNNYNIWGGRDNRSTDSIVTLNVVVDELLNEETIKDTFYDSELFLPDSTAVDEFDPKTIPPSSVLAFWNPKFDQTILATREFERRMATIHQTCEKKLLQLYTSNLNKPMWYIDSLAMSLGFGAFELFYAERVGALNLTNPHLANLTEFYTQGIESIQKEIAEIRAQELKAEKEWDEQISVSRLNELLRETDRKNQNFNEEYNFNHGFVSQQLGFTQSFLLTSNVIIVNIDREVRKATENRKTTSFSFKGKTSTIQYNDFSFEVKDHSNYKKLYAYLLPDEFSSYERIQGNAGKFNYPLNNGLKYTVVIFAMNEESYFYHETGSLNGGNLGEITLESITNDTFEKRIEKINQARKSENVMLFEDELSWLKLEQTNYKVQRQREEKRAFLERIRQVVFPCYEGQEYYEIVYQLSKF